MYDTIKAIIKPNGQIIMLEPISFSQSMRALITILGQETPATAKLANESAGMDFSLLFAALNEFPADFMAAGREQPATFERESF